MIATGFPLGIPRRTLFQAANTEPTEAVKEIHNIKVEKEEPSIIIDEEEKDWDAIPAFLRRRK